MRWHEAGVSWRWRRLFSTPLTLPRGLHTSTSRHQTQWVPWNQTINKSYLEAQILTFTIYYHEVNLSVPEIVSTNYAYSIITTGKIKPFYFENNSWKTFRLQTNMSFTIPNKMANYSKNPVAVQSMVDVKPVFSKYSIFLVLCCKYVPFPHNLGF